MTSPIPLPRSAEPGDSLRSLASLAARMVGAEMALVRAAPPDGSRTGAWCAAGAAAEDTLSRLPLDLPIPGIRDGRALADLSGLSLPPESPWAVALAEAGICSFAAVQPGSVTVLVASSRPRRWPEDSIAALDDVAGTATRLSDAEFAARLLDQLPDPVTVRQGDRFLYVNEAALRETGAARREDIVGRPWTEFVEPELSARFEERFREAVESGGDLPPLRARFRRSSGGYLVADVRSMLLKLEGGMGTLASLRIRRPGEATDDWVGSGPGEYAAVLEDAPDVIVRLDADGRVAYVNPAARRYLGVSPESLIAGQLGGAATKRLLARWRRAVRQVQRTAQPTMQEFTMDAAGGRAVLQCRYTPHLGPDGEVVGVIAVARDITELKRTEAALRLSEARLRAMVNSAAIGVALMDEAGTCVDVNAAFADMVGHTREELVGVYLGSVVAPEDRQMAEDLHQRLVRREIERGQIELRYQHKDGRIVWGRLSKTPVLSAGKRYFLSIIEDITARKEAEEALKASEARFRSLIERSSDLITVIAADGTLTYASSSFEQVLGYPARDLIGSGLFDKFHPADKESARSEWQRLLADPATPISVEYRLRHADGSWRTLHSIAQNRLDDPTVAGVVANTRDVTAAREMEAQLAQSQKMEAVGRLAGGIAHDFNNILTAIQGHASMLVEELPTGSPHMEDAIEIQRSAERAAGLTRQLLAFSRRQVLQPKPVDLNAMVSETERMLRRLIGEDIELVTELAPELGVIRADPAQVQQILVNLAVNARDAMPGGGRLVIRTSNAHLDEATSRGLGQGLAPGHYVTLTVTDTGAGIDSGILDRIFEPFFTTKEPGQGTGLGLSSVYGTVKQSGGSIWLETAVGQGTTFHVYLPRAEATDEATPEPPQEPDGNGGVILLVEDEASVRALAQRVLKRAGYTVLEAVDGEDALRVCREHPDSIDLVLSDVVMPRLGGAELADRLATLRPDTPVLLMSGYTRDALTKHGLVDSAGFLAKPFSPEVLRLAVEQALQAPRRGA